MAENTRGPVSRAGGATSRPAKKKTSISPETSGHEGERIAKVLSRRGVASRREAERLIEAGEVRVNGKVIDSPALNVTDADRITISGHPLPEREPARLWLYYKPEGLVTSASDEKGRDTVFDWLPEDMPRVMSVGRLDLNSEGLLLLTNDGELKRQLELPSTGWLRKYRVRVKGNPTDPEFEPLRKGVVIDGEKFLPMQVTLDRHQGSNAWLTVGLREGRNREIRRAMAEVNLQVNRLIRVSYGPFRLGELEPGEVEEIRPRVLKDQLGAILAGADIEEIENPRPGTRKPTSTTPRRSVSHSTSRARAQAEAPDTLPPRPSLGRGAATRLPEGEGVRRLSRAFDAATRPARGTVSDFSRSGGVQRMERPDSRTGGRPDSRNDARGDSRGPASRSRDDAARPGRDTDSRAPRSFGTRSRDEAPSRGTSARPERDTPSRSFGSRLRDEAPARTGGSTRPQLDRAGQDRLERERRGPRAERPGSDRGERATTSARPPRGTDGPAPRSSGSRRDDNARDAGGSKGYAPRGESARGTAPGKGFAPRGTDSRSAGPKGSGARTGALRDNGPRDGGNRDGGPRGNGARDGASRDGGARDYGARGAAPRGAGPKGGFGSDPKSAPRSGGSSGAGPRSSAPRGTGPRGAGPKGGGTPRGRK